MAPLAQTMDSMRSRTTVAVGGAETVVETDRGVGDVDRSVEENEADADVVEASSGVGVAVEISRLCFPRWRSAHRTTRSMNLSLRGITPMMARPNRETIGLRLRLAMRRLAVQMDGSE